MSITYATATANARLAAEFTAAVSGQSVDGGSGVGQLVIGTASLTTGSLASNAANVLVTVALYKPSVAIASKVATLYGPGSAAASVGNPITATASASGTAALANLYDSAGNFISGGYTVGTSGTNIVIGSTTINSGNTVQVTAGTWTHP